MPPCIASLELGLANEGREPYTELGRKESQALSTSSVINVTVIGALERRHKHLPSTHDPGLEPNPRE